MTDGGNRFAFFKELSDKGKHFFVFSERRWCLSSRQDYKIVAALSLNQIDPSSYDLVILPGGKAPEELRKNEKLLSFIQQFFAQGKAVAAICHGPQILVSAGVLAGIKATCYRSVADELQAAGCHYSDEEVVVDGNLITSRIPADLPAFMREIIKKRQGLD